MRAGTLALRSAVIGGLALAYLSGSPGHALAADPILGGGGRREAEVRRALSRAALASGKEQVVGAVQELLEGGLAASIDRSIHAGSNEYLAAELFPHNLGAHVEFRDEGAGSTFRRTVFRRDFHHNGIRLLIHRGRGAGDYELETYQIGGGIGVRMDSARIGQESLGLEPAVQLLSVRPRLGETFTTAPDALHPSTGRRMTWTCRTVAIELLDLADGGVVPSVAVEVLVHDAERGDRLAGFRVWYGDNMGIARRQGDYFGVPVDEMAQGGLVLPR